MPAAHVGAVKNSAPWPNNEHAWPIRFRRAHVSSSPDNSRWPALTRAAGANPALLQLKQAERSLSPTGCWTAESSSGRVDPWGAAKLVDRLSSSG